MRISEIFTLRDGAKPGRPGELRENALCIGTLEQLNDQQWNRAAAEFFGRAN